MNLQILPLSELQPFVYQKCLIPNELFPQDTLPGTLARCIDSSGVSCVCNIYPLKNQQQGKFCWLDDTVQVGTAKDYKTKSLVSLEILNNKIQPALEVLLTFKINEKLFKVIKHPTREILARLSKELLKPYTFVNKSNIRFNELKELGISKIYVETKSFELFTIQDETKIVVFNVKLQTNDYIVRSSLKAMEQPQKVLQELIENASTIKNLNWKIKPSLNALILGPSGCGKSSLATNFIIDNNCNFYIIRSANILKQYPGETEAELRSIFNNVKRFNQYFQPNDLMVILIEDLDLLCPTNKITSNDNCNTTRVSGQLVALLDNLHCTTESSKIIVLATSSKSDEINSSLRRPGRFAIEINIPTLTEYQRGIVFNEMIHESFYKESVTIDDDLLNEVAKQTQGFIAADLALLVDLIGQDFIRNENTNKQFKDIVLNSLKLIKPASFRGTDVSVYKTEENFNSIGGMLKLKRTLQISVLAGLKQKAAFERFGLCLPKGILLYGPPGCAKTTVAKCLATEANMTFIPTSAAEVYSPYVGNSEKYISKIFDTARKNSPCLIFFDEIDSLVGKRTSDSKSDIQTRILSTLLTEMDGIGVTLFNPSSTGNNILVVAATNRPEMIDDALMRPGRFDKLIHVPAPDYDSRLQILKIHADKMPFASDVDKAKIAKDTENFSGADICNLCNEAAMYAFTQNIEAEHITMKDFLNVLKHQKSSLTQSQIQWYAEFESSHKR